MNMDNLRLIIPAVVLLLLLAQSALKFLPKPIVKRKPALPGGSWQLIYTDNASAKEERKPGVVYGKLLAAPRYGLHGKPDFIYSNGRQLLPVELKSGRVGDSPEPREGDLMQLAAYFHLAEAEYDLRAYKGCLIYGDAMFIIRNTGALRRELAERVDAMRAMLEREQPGLDPEDAEPSFAKCRHCPCRGTVCEFPAR